MRASKEFFNDCVGMQHAWIEASRSKCARGLVGATATSPDGRVLASGYNGTVEGEVNCCDHFAHLGRRPTREEHRPWSDLFEVHAEMNLLAFAARHGIRLEGCTVYCTKQPCWPCLKALGQVRIARLVFDEPHSRNSESQDEWSSFCRRRQIEVFQLPAGWRSIVSVPLSSEARYISPDKTAESLGGPVVQLQIEGRTRNCEFTGDGRHVRITDA